jgi:molybdopterin-synthase adenylyltransferase
MNDNQLLQYHRHIMLPPIGASGQETLLTAKILIIGLGGLGSPAALYLAASGIGHLYLNDFDHVDLSNLQRQILHNRQQLHWSKTHSAEKTLNTLNPDCQLTLLDKKLDNNALQQTINQVDLVIDASDNFDTRFLVNRCCKAQNKPLISGSAIGFQGQVSVFDYQPQQPCYQCLFDEQDYSPENRCSNSGILAPLAGLVGTIQAIEAIKVLLDMGNSLKGRLLSIDAMNMEFKTSRLQQDPACRVCHLSGVET